MRSADGHVRESGRNLAGSEKELWRSLFVTGRSAMTDLHYRLQNGASRT